MQGDSEFRSWDEMSPDLLGLIFKNLLYCEVLGVIPMVCKSWCRVVEGPYCWDKIDLSEWDESHHTAKIDRMLRTLVARSQGCLRELSVSMVDDQMLSFIAEHARSLRSLKIDRGSISDSVLEKVAPKLSSLTTLHIRGEISTNIRGEISTQALEAIGSNCKKLESFSWRDDKDWVNKPFTEVLFRAISKTMPKIKHLCLARLGVDPSDVLIILSGCPELESLDILGCWGCEYGLDFKSLKETYPRVKVEGPAGPTLKELQIMLLELNLSDISDFHFDSSIFM